MSLKFLRSALLKAPLLATLLAPLPVAAQQVSGFLSVIEDLPLMSALIETGEGVQFSTSQGRIAEATAKGNISRSAVLDFYEKTLPQLGWTPLGPGRFSREGETLELGFEAKGERLSVRFAIVPKNKP